MAAFGEVLWWRLGRWARAARVGEQTQMRPVEISAALGGVVSRLIDGRDVERECEGTYAHIWIMGWYHVTSGLLLT